MKLWHWIISQEDNEKLEDRWYSDVEDQYNEEIEVYEEYLGLDKDSVEEEEWDDWEEVNQGLEGIGDNAKEFFQVLEYLEGRNLGLFMKLYENGELMDWAKKAISMKGELSDWEKENLDLVEQEVTSLSGIDTEVPEMEIWRKEDYATRDELADIYEEKGFIHPSIVALDFDYLIKDYVEKRKKMGLRDDTQYGSLAWSENFLEH